MEAVIRALTKEIDAVGIRIEHEQRRLGEMPPSPITEKLQKQCALVTKLWGERKDLVNDVSRFYPPMQQSNE